MTPQLYVKLSGQIARQTPELDDYAAEIIDRNIRALNLQPAIDAAQIEADAAHAAFTALPEEADKTSEQAALTAANTALEAAKSAQRIPESEGEALTKQADAIRASIAQCQAEIDASGLVMTDAEMDAIRNAPVIPAAVTMRQARLALLGAGLLSAVDAAINALEEPTKSAAKIEWEYAQEVARNYGLVSALAPALGMTSAQIDALFIAAAKL